MGIHCHDGTSSPWRQADDRGLWTSANRQGWGNFYIGATRVTNNTGEMQGVIEALFWLNTCVERGTLHADDGALITVDSLCVKGAG